MVLLIGMVLTALAVASVYELKLTALQRAHNQDVRYFYAVIDELEMRIKRTK